MFICIARAFIFLAEAEHAINFVATIFVVTTCV